MKSDLASAVDLANSAPASWMPSPESPANRTTRGWVRAVSGAFPVDAVSLMAVIFIPALFCSQADAGSGEI